MNKTNNAKKLRINHTSHFPLHTSNHRGITLVALIITIIVMLILVGVTVTIALNGGLFNYSKNAVDQTKVELAKENDLDAGKVKIGDEVYDSIDEYTEEISINWSSIIADANANPSKYKHSDQAAANNNIGIGTDGKPVNMDLWDFVSNDSSGTIGLYSLNGGPPAKAYKGEFDEGKIIGKVPQYIKPADKNSFMPVTVMYTTFQYCTGLVYAPKLPKTVTSLGNTYGAFQGCTNLVKAPNIPSSVTDMTAAFNGCTSLIEAPEIPSRVTNMQATFYGCTSLTKAPEIPSSVTNMQATFYGCTKLTGDLVINSNPTNYSVCLNGCATDSNCNLKLSGISTILEQLLATKSENSHISLK